MGDIDAITGSDPRGAAAPENYGGSSPSPAPDTDKGEPDAIIGIIVGVKHEQQKTTHEVTS